MSTNIGLVGSDEERNNGELCEAAEMLSQEVTARQVKKSRHQTASTRTEAKAHTNDVHTTCVHLQQLDIYKYSARAITTLI